MNEIKVLISFEKRINRIIGVDLTSGDYNSTKLIFDFDRQDGTKVFELKNPRGELVFAKEIENNEIILARVSEDGTYSSLFDMSGDYIFEVSLYTEDSKLTSEYEILPVEPEQVVIGDTVVEPYLPIFDELIQKVNTAINETNNLDLDIQDSVITITKKDGTTKSENVKGDSYVITDQDLEEIETNVKSDIQPILENIENVANQAEIIAKGKSQSVVVETFAELEEWLKDSSNKGTHIVGDNLYIKARYTDETETTIQPDYWVAEVLEEPNEKGYYYEISELGAEKPDLTEYAKKEQFVTLTQDEYDKLSANGTYTREDGTVLIFSTNTYYFIIEEE